MKRNPVVSALGLIPGQPHTASGLRWVARPHCPLRFPVGTFAACPFQLSPRLAVQGSDGRSLEELGTVGEQVECFCTVLSVSFHADADYKIAHAGLQLKPRAGHPIQGVMPRSVPDDCRFS